MDFETLKNLFISNANKAIEESKKMICSATEIDSYKNFISHFEKDAQFSICPSKYSDEQQLCVCCLDCTLNEEEPTTMCVSCFLNGNHEGHNFFILKKNSGICSCGDRDFLKDTCICSKHRGFNEEESHPEMNLNENLRTVLTDIIFKAAFLSFKPYVDDFNRSVSIIFDFLMDFTKLGDGFIRLIVQTLFEKIDFDDEFVGLLFNNFDTFNDCAYKLFYSIISDQIFRKHLTKSLYHFIFDNLGPDSPHHNYFFSNVIWNKKELNYKRLIDICFSEQSCIYNIEENQWDWVESCIKLLKNSRQLFDYDLDICFQSSPPIFQILSKVQYMTKLQPNEATQSLFDKMVTDVFNIDNNSNKTVIISTFKKLILISRHSAFLSFLKILTTFLNCFKSKPNLQMDKLIQELDKIDISPIYLIGKNEFAEENDVLVSKYLLQKNEENNSFFKKFKSMITKVFKSYPSKYYKSFCYGSSIFLSYPLYDIFGLLLRVDDLCRIKLSKLLCLENYRPLRLKLGIIAMKKLLSLNCLNCGLTNTRNKALISFYDSIMRQNEAIKLNLIPVSILQIMIGLQSCDKNEEFAIKEFFAYEIAREVGLFDKNFSNQIKYKFVIFLYVVLLIVIDRTIFYDDNCEKSIEERLILGLKNNVKSIDYISLLLGNVFPNKPHMFYKMFNEILMKVATTNKNETNKNKDKKENEEEDEDESNLMKSLLQSQVLPNNNNNDDDNDEDDENENENNQNENENDHVDNENENYEKEKEIRYGKNVMFYLKNGIEWKPISASTSICYQMILLNSEISKNPEKLLQLQTFEPEETFFFKSNEESQIDSEGLHICLKELFLTPTVFAVIYAVLTDVDKLNLHLAMNILILISKIIKESETTSSISPITINETIVCNSISDLVSQLKKIVFNFRIEGENDSKQGFIENTINSVNFISLMNLKISYNQKEPKSFIDLLKMNGKIGEETLERISQSIPIDEFSNDNKNKEEQNEEKEFIKQLKKEKANRKKAEIMNHFQDQLNQYHFSDSLSESLSINKSDKIPFNKDVCCICSESGRKKILCYPVYMYRTKFPFIIDKPPLFDKEEDTIAIDDNQIDFGNRKNFIDLLSTFSFTKGLKEDQLVERKKFIMKILQKEEYNEDSPKKRYTAGENYVFQFGIDTHPVHIKCILGSVNEKGVFKCSIDNSYRNNFLPYLEDVPINEIFSNIETFELNNSVNGQYIISTIHSFVNQYIKYFNIVQNTNKLLELIKSISGLIVTYEVRLRNRPDALDQRKNKILSRNLFLLTWYYFRILKKPTIFIEGKSGENIFNESRMTDFQRLIKMLIDCDDILDKEEKIQQIIPSIISSIIDENVEIREKKICLFLRRLCLAEYFLLNNDVNLVDADLIDWDEILTAKNLSKRYKVKFTSIDVENDDFEFKPFSFMNFPKDFLGFSQKPFNYPIQFHSGYSFINLLDYNYMINYYDDLEDNNNSNQNDEDLHFKNIFVDIKEEEEFGYYCIAYCCRVCPSILMFMQNLSPTILIIDHSFFGFLMPTYFDKYGCIQLQYERNLPIFFNENSYEILIDKILSGDFSYDLLSSEEVAKGIRH